MSKPLLIVESPTKVKTLKKYIGKKFNIAATVGHIIDLPPKELGIEVENSFKPKYTTIPGKAKVITALKKAAGKAEEIYLAPDPDREGEAIAWHAADVLKKKNRKFYRVLFHELTKNGITEAIESPQELNSEKYEAQQARRILDRLVGYQVSPLLWRKVKGGLSAGRVQSVSVRIICEREREIYAFETEEYWSLTATFDAPTPPPFEAKLVKKKGKKLKIPNKEASDQILSDLEKADYIIDKLVKKTTKRNPLPPFTTSKLQQDAIRKLHFTAKKTMTVAQQLYEGIELGPGEPVGLITYMRTDSTRIAMEAAVEAKDLVTKKFGADYALPKPRFFKNKNKTQDAHEAIRPTSAFNTPDDVRPYLSKDQFRLYELIWKRFVASQMAQALIDQTSAAIKAGDYTFNASGSIIKFPGYMTLYLSADQEIESQKKKGVLPELAEGMKLALKKLDPKQHFTAPPPRFTEASLVKELEENGIGRPSTYAAILSTIRAKGYVDLLKGSFKPTELGFIVNDLLVETFPDIFNVDFTAKMENNLDLVEASKADSIEILSDFYTPFKQVLDTASDKMTSIKGVGVPTPLECPDCKKVLHIKVGKSGPFLACEGYPDCKFSTNYSRDEKGTVVAEKQNRVADIPTDEKCEKCEKPLVIKQGKYGPFMACTGFPKCKNTRSLSVNGKGLDIKCPEDGCDGGIAEKKSKRGKIFYGCTNYPKCTFASWDKPVAKACPACSAPLLFEKSTKKEGKFLACADKKCGHKEPN